MDRLAAAVGLAVFSLMVTVRGEGICQRTAQRWDCDRYDSPSSRERVCRLVVDGDGAKKVNWYTGTLEERKCWNFRYNIAQDVIDFCPGYAGMTMSLLCNFSSLSVIYRDGHPLTGGAAVTFSNLQKEHEGRYECRDARTNETLGEYNMTVRSEFYYFMLPSGKNALIDCR